MRSASIVLLVSVIAFVSNGMRPEPTMELSIETDAATFLPDSAGTIEGQLDLQWKDLLRSHRLDVNDTSVKYPALIESMLNLYRWAERKFNTYDRSYVIGTGKHGKVRLLTDNWLDSYYFRVPSGKPMFLAGTPSSNIGLQANYSILSLSYSLSLNSLLSGRKSTYNKFQVSFTCAKLYGEAYIWENRGSSRIGFIGKQDLTGKDSRRFNGVSMKTIGVTGIYIFNSRRFSLAAAYNLSNYQLRSQGSWLAGFNANFNDTNFDFTKLSEENRDNLELTFDKYKLGYNSFNLTGGYSYNWVVNRHWLINGTAMPGVGLSFTYADSTMGTRALLSANTRCQASVTYTTHQFFITSASFFHLNIIMTRDVRTMSNIANFQLSTGIRF